MVLKFFNFLRSHSFRELSWAPRAEHAVKVCKHNKTAPNLISAKSRAEYALTSSVHSRFVAEIVCTSLIAGMVLGIWCSSHTISKKSVRSSNLWPDSIHSPRMQWRWQGRSGLGSWPHWCVPSNPRSWFGNQPCQCQKSDHQGGTEHRWELRGAGRHVTTSKTSIVIIQTAKTTTKKEMLTRRRLPQPALSSVTLVRTLPVWMSENAQYCRTVET